jgi:hypothetical protein
MSTTTEYADKEYRPLGTPLYHYTSVEALQKIYESRTLHATHAAYVSDGSEIRLGLQVLLDLVVEQLRKAQTREAELYAWLRQFVSAQILSPPPVFLLCFSELRNMLSQWRGYSPLGRGVCIGFDHRPMIELAKRAGWEWLSCRYGVDSQRAFMNAYLTLFMREALAIEESVRTFEVVEQVWGKKARNLFVCAAHVKDKSFSEEREWRLVSPLIMTQHSSVKFRVGRYSLVPYVEFALVDQVQTNLPLNEIVVGPTPNPFAAEHAIMSMQLSIRPSDHTKVVPCEIPYREV